MRRLSFVTVGLLTACAARPATVPSPASSERLLTARIVAMSATMPRIAGTITMKPTDDESYGVSFELRGARANSQLEWAVRPGRCGVVVPDSDIGGRDAYRPIRIQLDGETHVTMKLRARLPDEVLRIDLMTDPGLRENVIACGLLESR